MACGVSVLVDETAVWGNVALAIGMLLSDVILWEGSWRPRVRAARGLVVMVTVKGVLDF